MIKPAKVITITSGKGGVGKTHTAVNLGLALTQHMHKVLILDADLGLANVNILLGFKPKANISDMLKGKASIQDIIISLPSGIDIIPAASGVADIVNLSSQDRLLILTAVQELCYQYNYMIVDTAAGIGDSVIYFNLAAEENIIIVTPEATSIADAYALIKVLHQTSGINEVSILVNKNPENSDGRKTYAKLAQIADRFLNVRLKYLGAITEDSAVSESLKRQMPYTELFPSSKASLDIQKIAKKINENTQIKPPHGGMQFFFNELIMAKD
ncbi:MAG: MinD/ParA family protein [Deltaproteobacteria bacterium]|jgi:flagellar biosynthesis protein FlhG|nr:MinD/ParA family protein [Deltaproteobacteria bacterium]